MSSGRRLKLAVVQSGNCPADHGQAMDRLIGLFEEAAAAGVDAVVFPELATTPYFGASGDESYKAWAQTVPGPDVALLAAAARRLGTGVIFGLYEKAQDGSLYNSAVVIDEHGSLVVGRDLRGSAALSYRKSSIPKSLVEGVPVDEKQFFEPGPGPVLFEAFGTRFTCVICYDRTFPEYWIAARAAGAETVVALVSSLGSRETLFIQELQVRAMETQVWVVAANRGGPETLAGTTVDYFGLSCVIGPDGAVIAQAGAHTSPEIIGAVLDLDAVPRIRESFPLERDRNPEIFRYLAEAKAAAAIR